MSKPQADFYYDIISPFTYLFLRLRAPLMERLELHPRPIFFPGLLRLQNNRGPAEVSEKRAHTYDLCIWMAKRHGIPMQFPKRHPFPSVAMQRLLLERNADWTMVDRAFDFVWAEGRDPDLEWPQFCAAIGLSDTTPRPEGPEIRQRLTDETAKAAACGVFGVPTVVLGGHVFWGTDTIAWVLDFLEDPAMFDRPEFRALRAIENPLIKP